MPTERKALPVIHPARCTGCGWCVAVCPPHVLSLAVVHWRKSATLHDETGCTGCAKCAVKCPFGAIAMLRITDRSETR
jgi:ferredoxin